MRIAQIRIEPGLRTPTAAGVSGGALSDGEAASARLLIDMHARAAGIVADLDDEGRWNCDSAHVRLILNSAFGPQYLPSQTYHPRGRAGAVAEDAAAILGAELTWAQPEAEEPPEDAVE